MKNVLIKKLSDTATLPTYGSENAACADLYSDEDTEIIAESTKLIHTGLSIQPPEGYYGAIFARSGLASKRGLRPANCVGICDEDYRGEYMIALHNDSHETQVIHKGDRIAQIMFIPYEQFNFNVVNELSETARDSGGFGSTGIK